MNGSAGVNMFWYTDALPLSFLTSEDQMSLTWTPRFSTFFCSRLFLFSLGANVTAEAMPRGASSNQLLLSFNYSCTLHFYCPQ